MKVEGNKLSEIKERFDPQDWIWVFESNFNKVLYSFLIERFEPDTSSLIHYESGSGLLSSLLIQSGFKVTGIEEDKRYRDYSDLLNAFDFQVIHDVEFNINDVNYDLIVHPLFLFFDDYENFVKYLFSFFPKAFSFSSTIITVLLLSEEIKNIKIDAIQSEFLVLSNDDFSNLFEFLLTLNILMEIHKTGEFIDHEKKVEQLIVTFSPLP